MFWNLSQFKYSLTDYYSLPLIFDIVRNFLKLRYPKYLYYLTLRNYDEDLVLDNIISVVWIAIPKSMNIFMKVDQPSISYSLPDLLISLSAKWIIGFLTYTERDRVQSKIEQCPLIRFSFIHKIKLRGIPMWGPAAVPDLVLQRIVFIRISRTHTGKPLSHIVSVVKGLTFPLSPIW